MTETRREWRDGWPTLLSAAVGNGAGAIATMTLGAMIKPLSAAFGWSRGEIASAFIFTGIASLLFSPLVGRLVDRVGSRWVASVAIWFYAAALAAIGLTGPDIRTWYAGWAVLAITYPFISPIVWTSAVVSMFQRSRGAAIGLMACGTAVASVVMPFVAVGATNAVGWRGAYFTLGSVYLLLTLPVTLLFLKPVRAPKNVGQADGLGSALEGASLRDALRTIRFWKLGLAVTVVTAIAIALQIHLLPLFTDAGVAPLQAAAMASAIGWAAIAGRLVVGYLLDRISGPVIAGGSIGVYVVGMSLLLHYDGSVWRGVLAATIMGLGYGAETNLLSYLVSRYFGVRNYGVIFGALMGMVVFGSAIAPALAGAAFDLAGSYSPLIIVLIPILVAMAMILATLGPYPVSPSQKAALR